jgi:hypothetical protein
MSMVRGTCVRGDTLTTILLLLWEAIVGVPVEPASVNGTSGRRRPWSPQIPSLRHWRGNRSRMACIETPGV